MDISSLREAFSGKLLTDADEMAPYVRDWRGEWQGAAMCVAQPESTQQVADVVRWCHANRVPIVPQGGNTGLSGGAVPDASGRAIVLLLTKLNRIRSVDPLNGTLVAEAGCTLVQVQETAREAGSLFPLSLAAEGSCTIGGNLATNAGGTGVLRYGMMRDLCLGLEVVTASGEIWDGLKALRKDNTGYDLRDLIVGSEGTLGIITAAVLKTVPRPTCIQTAFVAIDGMDNVMTLFEMARRNLHDGLTAFELMSEDALALVRKHIDRSRRPVGRAPWYVLLEYSCHSGASNSLQNCLEAAISDGLIDDAAIAQSETQSRQFWNLREAIAPAQTAEGPVIKLDVSVPISDLSSFITQCELALEKWNYVIAPKIYGHVGDGNLHYDFSPATPADPTAFLAAKESVTDAVHEIVASFGGSVSAEHGLGQLRRDDAEKYRHPVATAIQRSIKNALDPTGILNPGRVLRQRPHVCD